MSVTVKAASAAIQAMFDRNKWKYHFETISHATLKFNLSKTKLGSVTIDVYILPKSNDNSICAYIMCYANIGMKADTESMHQVCEYITRANYGMRMGNFELDFRDGEIRFKMYCDIYNEIPEFDVLDDMVAVPIIMFNRYGNGLLAVLMGMMTPEAAIEQAEK